VISAPELPTETIRLPVSTIDIVPTVLDSTGESFRELPGKSLLDWGSCEQDSIVFSSAIGENNEDDINRFAAQTENRGFRFTRNHTTSEITDEAAYELPSGEIVEEKEKTEFNALREALVEYSEVRISRTPRQMEQESENNADIEARLEALGYK
jgi:hypothetical protein